MSLIDPGLLQILCCPETHQPVREADAAFVAELNSRIAAGAAKNRTGKVVTEKVDGALVRKDRQVAYPIRSRIPIMLVDEAIPL
ncbi:MAG TPA: Trm112 family protein [Candidatus Limnocylindria bacterium]|nr:Trm112 family protein [Candidatus Limnocylindria bacterium]